MNYFIQHLVTGEVKIGYSANPLQRLETLALQECGRTRNGFVDERSKWTGLRFLAAIPGGYSHERALHKRFSEFLVDSEWFDSRVLLPCIGLVFEWIKENANNHRPVTDGRCYLYMTYRQLAYDILWRWMAEGLDYIRLPGEIVWMGQRFSGKEIERDVSGARFSVDVHDLAVFAYRLQKDTE